MSEVVPGDQINVFAISNAVGGFAAVELSAWPERHSRKGLPDVQKAKLGPATTAKSVFMQSDRALIALQAKGARVTSFSCDGGVHGMECVASLQRTDGQCFSIVEQRIEVPLDGMLMGKFGVKLVICKTTDHHVLAGVLDPDHILKRNEEQLASGTHFIRLGPHRYVSFGFWAACDVPQDIIVKPDAMSDVLTGARMEPLRRLQRR
jgi:hypothetical protein